MTTERRSSGSDSLLCVGGRVTCVGNLTEDHNLRLRIIDIAPPMQWER